MLAPIRTLTSTCSFSRMMSDMSWIPSGPSLRPWTGETVKRISQILWPGRRMAMISLWWARFRWPLLPGVLSSGRTGCRWTGEGWRKRWPSLLWRPRRCLGPPAGGNRGKTALNRWKTWLYQTTRAHGSTWAQLYSKSIIYWPKYHLKQGNRTKSAGAGKTWTLTTFLGSLWPGRYLTFSCSVFMISVSLRPWMISS